MRSFRTRLSWCVTGSIWHTGTYRLRINRTLNHQVRDFRNRWNQTRVRPLQICRNRGHVHSTVRAEVPYCAITESRLARCYACHVATGSMFREYSGHAWTVLASRARIVGRTKAINEFSFLFLTQVFFLKQRVCLFVSFFFLVFPKVKRRLFPDFLGLSCLRNQLSVHYTYFYLFLQKTKVQKPSTYCN